MPKQGVLPTYTDNIQRKSKQGNKRKKKPREKKANQQANHPKNSEKKESSSSKTVETTQEETEKRGSSSKYLTSFPLGTFFGFALPKYTKKHKYAPISKLFSFSSLAP